LVYPFMSIDVKRMSLRQYTYECRRFTIYCIYAIHPPLSSKNDGLCGKL
jgi:hypothetical protein